MARDAAIVAMYLPDKIIPRETGLGEGHRESVRLLLSRDGVICKQQHRETENDGDDEPPVQFLEGIQVRIHGSRPRPEFKNVECAERDTVGNGFFFRTGEEPVSARFQREILFCYRQLREVFPGDLLKIQLPFILLLFMLLHVRLIILEERDCPETEHHEHGKKRDMQPEAQENMPEFVGDDGEQHRLPHIVSGK